MDLLREFQIVVGHKYRYHYQPTFAMKDRSGELN